MEVGEERAGEATTGIKGKHPLPAFHWQKLFVDRISLWGYISCSRSLYIELKPEYGSTSTQMAFFC